MRRPGEAELIRIFIGESDRSGDRLLYEVIVEEAHRRRLAGATVLRGIMGFGARSRLHTTRVLRLSEDLPVIVEILDRAEKLDDFLSFLDEVVQEGLITRERANVIVYRQAPENPAG